MHAQTNGNTVYVVLSVCLNCPSMCNNGRNFRFLLTFQAYIPSSDEQELLKEAGLGEKMVSLRMGFTPEDVKDAFIQAFPKMKDAGGVEYMRATARKKLCVIQLPEDGFTGKCIKGAIKQGRLYLRPIQSNISLVKSVVSFA